MTAGDWQTVRLTAQLAALTTLLLLLLGTPLAWWLSRTRSSFKPLVASLVAMPLVLPPTVLGYGILVMAGRQSALGAWLREHLDYSLIFSWHGAVVASALVGPAAVDKVPEVRLKEVAAAALNPRSRRGRGGALPRKARRWPGWPSQCSRR